MVTQRTERVGLAGSLRAVRGPAAGVALLLAVSLVVFLALDSLPGDAASQSQGMQATAASLARQRSAWGLDEPVLLRYWSWLCGALTGDLGVNLANGRPVADLLAGPLGRTAALAALALLGSVIVGVGVGLLTGLRSDTPTDRVLSVGALLAVCTPEFVVAVALVTVFAGLLGVLPAVSLLPVGGSLADRPAVLVLPAVTLIVVASGALARLVRPVVRAQARSPHVEAARLDGLPAGMVLRHHLLPGVIGPIGVLIAMVLPYLLGGAVVVEAVFGYPGLGSLLVESVTAREPAPVMAIGVGLVAVTLLGYGLAEALARTVDPRRRPV